MLFPASLCAMLVVISPTHRHIKYSLDFLRPIRTAEAFEAVDWLADLPQRTWPQAAGRLSDVILMSFCWSQQPQSWRRPCLLGIVRRLQLRWLARSLWSHPPYKTTWAILYCYPMTANSTLWRKQVALLWQRDRARHLSVEILQLQNISLKKPYRVALFVWFYV